MARSRFASNQQLQACHGFAARVISNASHLLGILDSNQQLVLLIFLVLNANIAKRLSLCQVFGSGSHPRLMSQAALRHSSESGVLLQVI